MSSCNYCEDSISEIEETLTCTQCQRSVHSKCLKRETVPGGLIGDIFYSFTCHKCSSDCTELFSRDKITWVIIIYLVLYNLYKRSPGLSRNGFYHWKIHVAAFIDKNWDLLFPIDYNRRKNWIGTVSGCLSVHNYLVFTSGTQMFNEQGWWTLTYPNLPPLFIHKYCNEIIAIKGKLKVAIANSTEFHEWDDFLREKINCEHILQKTDLNISNSEVKSKNTNTNTNDARIDTIDLQNDSRTEVTFPQTKINPKRKHVLPSFESYNDYGPKRLFRMTSLPQKQSFLPLQTEEIETKPNTSLTTSQVFKDSMCHYNTTFHRLSHIDDLKLESKIFGRILEDSFLSPYSNLYLKPYIRRDVTSQPLWLKLMAELQVVSNYKNKDYTLPARYPIDYTYVQPSHIPAINSLCNYFFWPGIDLTDCLNYPDFSCVAFYKRLIIGFAFIVPDVGIKEGYISFIFVRPAWRNVGIAQFMLYHLIQTYSGKDITLHVSIDNPALCLYQKFGFKVEKVVLDFYDKYFRKDAKESKHAFFCRLER